MKKVNVLQGKYRNPVATLCCTASLSANRTRSQWL